MPFRFTLATLLRLRQSIERQRTLQLQKANLEVARAADAVAQLDRFLSDSAQDGAKGLSAGCTAAELQFASLLRENFLCFRVELQTLLRDAETSRQKALVEYHEAFREREALEGLRARQRRDYEQEELRRQQRDLDADFLLQRWHRRS